MNSETKNCQNCKNDFIIEPEDFVFYDKIKVPPPTFCPSCSHQRRLAWRNTHSLHHRKDPITGQNIISIYHPDAKINAVNYKYWWSDEWDPFDYGMEFDFSKDFFSQWQYIQQRIPFQALSNSKAVNSEYCNVAEESYDSYLVSASWKSEKIMYSDSVTDNKECSDLYVVHKSQFCYEDSYCSESYKLFYSEKSVSCTDSYFLYDCKGCTDCFMSSNLRNKSYYFMNEPLSKDEYKRRMSEMDLGSFSVISSLKDEYNKLKLRSIHKYANLIKCYNSTGDDSSGVNNSQFIFDSSGNMKDSKYIYWTANNIFDCYYCNAIGLLESSFETCDSGVGGRECHFDNVVYSSNNVEYSFNCYNSSYLFGCIGLRSKSYCILNRQYSKEEYFEILPKVKEHMNNMPYVDKAGRVYKYGEFFPIEFSPFAYNETVANNFYPLTKEQIINNGFEYRESEVKNFNITKDFTDLPDSISECDDSILEQVISCSGAGSYDKCATAFKIIPDELAFYRRFNIPLPRKCYQCRHHDRFIKRNPLMLWHRSCMCEKAGHEHAGVCTNNFETSYSPDRPEIIYCESCYQKEVL